MKNTGKQNIVFQKEALRINAQLTIFHVFLLQQPITKQNILLQFGPLNI